MNVEDCATLSHILLDFIADQDPLAGDYEIEVSSPGIDRPLTRLSDFARWKGHDARIELSTAIDGRKRFRGRLEGLDGNDVAIRVEGALIRFPFAQIADAKLMLTDKLIEEDLRARKRARPRQEN